MRARAAARGAGRRPRAARPTASPSTARPRCRPAVPEQRRGGADESGAPAVARRWPSRGGGSAGRRDGRGVQADHGRGSQGARSASRAAAAARPRLAARPPPRLQPVNLSAAARFETPPSGEHTRGLRARAPAARRSARPQPRRCAPAECAGPPPRAHPAPHRGCSRSARARRSRQRVRRIDGRRTRFRVRQSPRPRATWLPRSGGARAVEAHAPAERRRQKARRAAGRAGTISSQSCVRPDVCAWLHESAACTRCARAGSSSDAAAWSGRASQRADARGRAGWRRRRRRRAVLSEASGGAVAREGDAAATPPRRAPSPAAGVAHGPSPRSPRRASRVGGLSRARGPGEPQKTTDMYACCHGVDASRSRRGRDAGDRNRLGARAHGLGGAVPRSAMASRPSRTARRADARQSSPTRRAARASAGGGGDGAAPELGGTAAAPSATARRREALATARRRRVLTRFARSLRRRHADERARALAHADVERRPSIA